MLDKIIKINFKQNLFVRSVDYIIFFSFPSSFCLYNIPTALFSCSPTALKIANFTRYAHKLMKREVLREEFLQKYFFRKAHIILNIFIYYHFFLSLIVLNLCGFEISLENLLFRPKWVSKITLRVSRKDSRISVRKDF